MSTPAQEFRSAIVGIPTDPTKQPETQRSVRAIESLWRAMSASVIAGLVKSTRAELLAVPTSGVTAGAVVLDDPDPAKNGFYSIVGGDWTKGRGFPDTFAQLTVEVSPPNAIVATPAEGVNPADITLMAMVPADANSGPVTVAVGGAGAKSLRLANGGMLSAGYLVPGRAILFRDSGSQYRLVSELHDTAVLAAAEAAVANTEAQLVEAGNLALAALNATSYGSNGGRFLLGFENGIGVNFAQNDAGIIGGDTPVISALPEDVFTFARASQADIIDGDRYIDLVASGDLALTRFASSGQAAGLFVGAVADDLAYSPDDLSAVSWTKASCTVTAAQGIAPDGANTGWKVQDTSNSIYGDLSTTVAIPALTTTGYVTASFFMKTIDAVLVQCRVALTGGTTLTAVVSVNVSTKVIASATFSTATLTELRDGWMRVDVVVQNNGSANVNVNQRIRIEASDLASMRSILFWKPKIFLGARYLGIVDSRAADVVTLPLSEIDWNSHEGTLCCDVGAVPEAQARVVLLQVDDGTEDNRIALVANASGQLFGEFVKGGVPVNIAGVDVNLGGRAAIAWNGADASLVYNGTEITAIANAPSMAGLTTLRIGSNSAGVAQPQTVFSKLFYKPRRMTTDEIINAGVVSGAGGVGSNAFTAGEIAAEDGRAIAEANALRANGNPNICRFREGNNHVLQYGQSFSLGAFGHPPRAFTRAYDALMLGGSIRPASSSSPTFTPFGSSVLNPIDITVETGSTILDATEIAALDWAEDGHSGETSAHIFTEMAKFFWNQSRAVDNDAARKFVVTSTGRGGTTIEDLSAGADHFDRTVNGASKVETASGATPCQLHMVVWEQGEANAPDGSTYKSDLAALKEDIEADIATAIYGQARMPGFFMSQMGGLFANDGAEPTTVSQEQLEFALEHDDVFLYAPNYRVTNKPNGHLDANGYRWMGLMLAKCWWRVMVKGEGWKPLHINRAIQRGTEILLAYHVPTPPLQFAAFYDGFTASNFATKGFLVVDGSGTVPITEVEIVGGATVLISLGREIDGTATVKYGTKATFNGGGNIMDSDALHSAYTYAYRAAQGDDASVNVAALVNKAYPLENPACLQTIVATDG